MSFECTAHHDACACQEAEHLYQIEWRDREIARLRDALKATVDAWTEQFERNGHRAPEWVKKARAALMPNMKIIESPNFGAEDK